MEQAGPQLNTQIDFLAGITFDDRGEFSPEELTKVAFLSIVRGVFAGEEAIILAIRLTEATLIEQIKRDQQYKDNVQRIEANIREKYSEQGFTSTNDYERYIQTQVAWGKLGELCSLKKRLFGESLVYRLSADKTIYGKTKALTKLVEMKREEARRNELRI